MQPGPVEPQSRPQGRPYLACLVLLALGLVVTVVASFLDWTAKSYTFAGLTFTAHGSTSAWHTDSTFIWALIAVIVAVVGAIIGFAATLLASRPASGPTSPANPLGLVGLLIATVLLVAALVCDFVFWGKVPGDLDLSIGLYLGIGGMALALIGAVVALLLTWTGRRSAAPAAPAYQYPQAYPGQPAAPTGMPAQMPPAGYGPPVPGQYGQPAPIQPAPGQYGQPAPGQYGQPVPGQPAPGQYGQPNVPGFGQQPPAQMPPMQQPPMQQPPVQPPFAAPAPGTPAPDSSRLGAQFTGEQPPTQPAADQLATQFPPVPPAPVPPAQPGWSPVPPAAASADSARADSTLAACAPAEPAEPEEADEETRRSDPS